MKTKLILIGIIVLLLIGLFIGSYIVIKQKQEIADLTTEIRVKSDTIVRFADKNDLLVARIGTYEKRVKELKRHGDSLEKRMLNEARNNKIKDRKIKELEYILISSRDTLTSPITDYSDTIVLTTGLPEKYHSSFSNGFLCADVYVEDYSMKLIYDYQVEIFKTKHMIRPESDSKFLRWLGISFKKKQEVSDYKLSDSNATIINVKEIIIKK